MIFQVGRRQDEKDIPIRKSGAVALWMTESLRQRRWSMVLLDWTLDTQACPTTQSYSYTRRMKNASCRDGGPKNLLKLSFLGLLLPKDGRVVSAFVGPSRSTLNAMSLKSSFSRLVSHSPSLEEQVDSGKDPKAGWLKWMLMGAPRGTNRMIMREAPELGGIPRSDRYSSRDWFHNTITLPNSAILRDIRSPVIAITSWATFLSILHQRMVASNPLAASGMYIPGEPHSLMMSALGLLLVFRTNSAYQRFAEGRQIWENIVNSARDLYRMLMLYENEIGVDKRRRVQRLLAAFPYLLRHRIRPNLVMRRLDDEEYTRDPQNTILLYQDSGPKDLDPEYAALAQSEEVTGQSRRKTRPLYWVDKRTLPWRLLPPGALEKCVRAQNRPLWVCDRMSKEIRTVPDGPNFAARERLAIISHVDKLSRCIGAAERIHQTVVPLNYARHTLRALTVWLFTLPLALVKDLKLMTGPALFITSWLLFGVYEIGVRIEDPFQGTLRLSIMCDTIRRDVLADETIRSTAFQLEADELDDFVQSLDEEEFEQVLSNAIEDLEQTSSSTESDAAQEEKVVEEIAAALTNSTNAYQ